MATSAGRRALAWLPVVVSTATIVTVLLATGTAPADIVRYAGYLAFGLTLPGTLVYRALRRRPHSLVDDLAMGTAVGLVLEIAAWSSYAALDLHRLLWTWPILIVVAFAAVPRLRRHWWVRGYQPAPLAWSWCVAAMVVWLLAYLTGTFLSAYPPTPEPGGSWYHIDLPYMLSLAGEAKHHFPLANPQAAQEPLHYHWFSYADLASASLISGVDTPVVFFRLAPATLCALVVVLGAVAGWRVSGKPWVGALSTALVFVVGELSLRSLSVTSFGSVTAYTVWASYSMTYSLMFTFPLLVFVVERLRQREPAGPGTWVLCGLFMVGAAGAKSTILPVVLCGLGLAGLVRLIRTRRLTRDLIVLAGLALGAIGFATAALYHFESHGLNIAPLTDFRPFVVADQPRPVLVTFGVYILVGVAYLLFMFSRLAGIAVMAGAGGDDADGEWFLFGAFASGAVATLLLAHPGVSQNFFVRTSFVFGAVLSAMGYAKLVERYPLSRGTVAAIVVTAIGVIYAMTSVLRRAGFARPASYWEGVTPIIAPAVAFGVLIAVSALLWRYWGQNRWPAHRGGYAVFALTIVMLAGLPSLHNEVRDVRDPVPNYRALVTADEVRAARWLRDHTSPDDLVATNQHCHWPPHDPGHCQYTEYWLSAYSERRQLVGSWGYVPRTVTDGTRENLPLGQVPFWDSELLADNEALFYDPTAQRLADMRRRYGVRWLFVDRTNGVESTRLRELTVLRYELADVAIYELR